MVDVRSNSRISGSISLLVHTNACGQACATIALLRASCAPFMNALRKQMAMASTPASRNARAAASTSPSSSSATTRPL